MLTLPSWKPKRRPSRIRKRRYGWCFKNAYETARKYRLRYCEGLVFVPDVLPIPIHHAWCVTRHGYVVDPTYPNKVILASEYRGLVFPLRKVRAQREKGRPSMLFQPEAKAA